MAVGAAALMGWWLNFRINRAARLYAERLPPALRQGWGIRKNYTSDQIKAAAKSVGLNENFIALGYAAFLPEETFSLLIKDAPVVIGYNEARELFSYHLPHSFLSSEGNPAPDRSGMGTGGGAF